MTRQWLAIFHDLDVLSAPIHTQVEWSTFDLGKVSELYDSLKYDTLHNRGFMEGVFLEDDVASVPPVNDTVSSCKEDRAITTVTPVSTADSGSSTTAPTNAARSPLRDLFHKSKKLFDFVGRMRMCVFNDGSRLI